MGETDNKQEFICGISRRDMMEKIKSDLHVRGNILAEKVFTPQNGGYNLLCTRRMDRPGKDYCNRGRFARAVAQRWHQLHHLFRRICVLLLLLCGGEQAMSVTNGVISFDPIRVAADAAYVLQLTNASIAYICSNVHGKIVWWSRYKPIQLGGVPFPDRSGFWYRGLDSGCGLFFHNAYMSSYISVKDKMDNGYPLYGWEYLPPLQGEYRIVDMCGYDHNAKPPIQSFAVTEEVVRGNKLMGSWIMNGDQTKNPGSLSIYDIHIGGKPLAEWNLGVVVYDSKGNRKGRVVGNGLGSVEYDVSLLTTGQTYYAYPFIAEFPMGQDVQDFVNSYYLMPYTTKSAFKVISQEDAAGIVIELTGTQNLGVSWSLKITAKQDVQVLAGSVELRFASSAWNDQMVQGEYQYNLGAFNITSASAYTKTGVFARAEERPDYVLRLYLRTSAGIFEYEGALLQQIAPQT